MHVRLALAFLGLGLTAASPPPDPPSMFRLSLAGPTSFAITWTTPASVPSHCNYGLKPDALDRKSSPQQCAITSYAPNSFHHTCLVGPGLPPLKEIYYSCGDEVGGMSPTMSFRSSPPESGVADFSFTAAIFGDMGITNSAGTAAQLKSHVLSNGATRNTSDEALDLVFHVGDFAYADDRKQKSYEQTWDDFHQEIEPVSSRVPYMTCPGNHEAACHSYGAWFCDAKYDNFTAYRHRFRMPHNESGANSNGMWFSFNYGNVHFVSIDTETDYEKAPEGPDTMWHGGPFGEIGEQLKWLEADLKAANEPSARLQRPWIIVGGHRPCYSSSNPGPESIIWKNATGRLRDAVERIFYENAVDIYFSGHVHAYERAYPVYREQVMSTNYSSPSAPVHVIVGSAGNIEGPTKDWLAQPSWSANRNWKDFGYGLLKVHSAHRLDWEFRRASDDTVADQFSLSK